MRTIFSFVLLVALAPTLSGQYFRCAPQPAPDGSAGPLQSIAYHAPMERGTTHSVSIVFHVLYHTAEQNVSDATVLEQFETLNQDYSRTNPDAVNTPADLLSLASATDIRFCLASVDPQGMPTTGITHTYTDTALWLDTFLGNTHFFNAATGGVAAWDPFHYLNVYIIDRSYFAGTSGSGPHGEVWDVIGIDYPYFGNNHTLSHEVGHYFALQHVFGGTSGEQTCGNDLVDDTPPQTFHYDCPAYPTYSCGNTTISDLFMNYMNYSPSSCMNMFTAGQAARMLSCLTGSRSPLLESNGCGVVGVSEPTGQLNGFIVHLDDAGATLYISSSTGSPLTGEVRVLDAAGRLWRTGSIAGAAGQQLTLDVRDLPTGIYFVHIGGSSVPHRAVPFAKP